MNKILVGRARVRGGNDPRDKYHAKRGLLNDTKLEYYEEYDEETGELVWECESSAAKNSKMSIGRGSKELNENLAPFYRWLKKQVGRHWDDVYSDIRENINPNNAIQMHIMQHLWGYVEKDVFMDEDGDVALQSSYRGRGVIKIKDDLNHGKWFRNMMYIHPETHLLCYIELSKASKRQKKEKIVSIKEDDLNYICKMDNGIWYRIKYAKPQDKKYYASLQYGFGYRVPKQHKDIKMSVGIIHPWNVGGKAYEDNSPYSMFETRHISKNQLSSQDLKKFNLENESWK